MSFLTALVALVAAACGSEGNDEGCSSPQECPGGADCEVGACADGLCVLERAAAGTSCSVGICDDAGGCQCRFDDDCPAPQACEKAVCDQGACRTAPSPFGSVCPGGACDDDGVCVPFPCTDPGQCECAPGLGCSDAQQPNQTQESAAFAGNLTDCQTASFCGAVAEGEEDWFYYAGTDVFGCNVAPTVTFDNSNLEVCQYFSCTSTPTSFSCPANTTDSVAPGGQAGCCGRATWNVDPCAGGPFDDEDATVWVRVRRLEGETCEAYALTMEF